MRFWKMHGAGNDFIVTDEPVADPRRAAQILCDRRFGIGADGLILALPSGTADARMRIFNSDGSEAEMCGNGIRCLARYLIERGLTGKRSMTVETAGGLKSLSVNGWSATVNMGVPCMIPERVPVLAPGNEIVLDIDGTPARFFCVSMGNPHAVTFDIYPEREAFLRIAPPVEHNPVFPQRVNVEFARVNPDGGIDVRVWERGAGETQACGTGACASLAAAVCTGRTGRQAVTHLPGGDLFVRWAEDGCIYMTGGAQVSFTGETSLI